jgi:hypothetical protein
MLGWVGRAILPAAGFQPAGPAGKRVFSLRGCPTFAILRLSIIGRDTTLEPLARLHTRLPAGVRWAVFAESIMCQFEQVPGRT